MGLFGGSKKNVPATGFYAMPQQYQDLYNKLLGASSGLFTNAGGINSDAFTASGAGYDALMGGMAPTEASISSDIAMQQNPYDQYVIDAINTEAQGQNSVMNAGQARAGQFGSNRGLLGANNIDMSRLNQIGQFKQQGFNTAMNNALTTLPGMRQTDAMNNMNLTMQNKQAPYTALNTAQGFLNGAAAPMTGTQAYTVKSGGGLGGLLSGIGSLASAGGGVASALGYGSTGGMLSGLGSLMAFSDERLKENIVPMGQENGHNVYKFNYRNDPLNKTYIGVIAQEVQKTNPEAVFEHGDAGYLAVDYPKIGVNFREVQ